jgi:hypothetical protein
VRFPAPYTFQVVGKPEGTFVEDMLACIGGAVGRKIWEREVKVKERKGARASPSAEVPLSHTMPARSPLTPANLAAARKAANTCPSP